MISDTIEALINEGRTTQRELAELAGISTSAVSRYQTDQCGPLFDTVRLWVRHHPDPVVRQAFADCLLAGTGACVVWPSQPIEIDLNGDGVTDAADGRQAAVECVAQAAHAVQVAIAALEDGVIDEAENVAILRVRSAVRQAMDKLAEVSTHIARNTPPRRKARPLSYAHLNGNGHLNGSAR